MKITLIGIGVNAGDISLKAYEAIKSHQRIFLRTALTESGKYVLDCGIAAEPLDGVYLKSRNFDTLSENLAKTVLQAAKTQDVAYLVDGDVSEDVSCGIIIKKRKGKDVEIISGISRASAYLAKTGIGGGYFQTSAYELENANVSLPLVVTDVDNSFIAGKAKLLLSDKYGDEIPCYKFVNGNFKKLKLYEIDFENNFDYSSAIVIPKLNFLEKTRFDFDDLLEIVKTLRGENGCPWDRAQTKDSVKINAVEEVYELIDAVTKNDEDGICEEIGDVFLQAVFQIVFAEERNSFTYRDAISGICEKLIRRHTHIFGDDKATGADSALSIWDKNKQKEKGYSSGEEYLEAIPKNFPALLRAEKTISRAKKYNYYEEIDEVLQDIEEKLRRIKKNADLFKGEEAKDDLGELLLSFVKVLKHLGVESEEALSIATDRFKERFIRFEKAALKDGKNVKDLTEKEREKYYDESKKS